MDRRRLGAVGLVAALLLTSLEWPAPPVAAARPPGAAPEAAPDAAAAAPAADVPAAAAVDTRAFTQVTAGSPASGYVAIEPTRILDTRGRGGKPVKAGATVTAKVIGVDGLPASGVAAVLLNVAAVGPSKDTFLTVWSTGTSRPSTANLHIADRERMAVSNAVIVPVGADGTVSVFNANGQVDVVVDVQGWFPAAAGEAQGSYRPVTPSRLLDTRVKGGKPVKAGGTTNLTVTGVAGVPASGVTAVAINVTAVDPSRDSYLTVYPAGSPRPGTASLNVERRTTAANLVIAQVGANGAVTIFNQSGEVDLVIDVVGWFVPADAATGAGYHPTTPVRISDSRPHHRRLGRRKDVHIQVAGVGGIPTTGVSAVVVNVAVDDPSDDSFLTIWCRRWARPFTANLNSRRGVATSNLVIVPVADDGTISIYNYDGDTDVVLDVAGWFQEGQDSSPPTTTTTTTTTAPATTSTTTSSTTTTSSSTTTTDAQTTTTEAQTTTTEAQTTTTEAQTTTTDAPSSGTTTTTSSTSSTTSTTEPPSNGTTTTTSTTLPVEPPGPTAHRWRFDPAQILLAPGESTVVVLQASDPDTSIDVDLATPADTTFPATGAAGAVTVEAIGGNQVRVTAGTTIDTVIVAGQVPGLEIAPSLTVTIANLADGVMELPDERVAFPSAGVMPGTGTPIIGGAVTEAGVGPFTWDEIQARIHVPSGDMGVTDFDAIDTLEYWYPVVLVDIGPLPVPGSLVIGTGGSGVSGRVISPDGAPTLRRGGYVLVSVQIEGPATLFQDFHYSMDYAALLAIGVVGAPSSESPGGTGPAGPAFAGGGSGRAVPSQVARPNPLADPPPADPDPSTTEPSTEPDNVSSSSGTQSSGGGWRNKASECMSELVREAAWNTSAVEVAPATSLTLTPIFDVQLDVSGWSVTNALIRVGGKVEATLKASLKIRAQASLSSQCTLGTLDELRVMLPGALAALIELYGRGEIKFKPGVKITGGPTAEVGFSCTFALSMVGGFSYTAAGGFTNLSTASTEGTECKPIFNVATSATEDGLALQIETTLAIVKEFPMGIQIGGVVGRWIGKVLEFFSLGSPNFGQVDLIKSEVGPQLRLTWENTANALTNRDAATWAGAEGVGKAFLELKVLSWMMRKLTGARDNEPGTVEFPLFSITIPIVTGYPTMKKSGDITATVAGETADTSKTIYVQEGDQLELTTTLAPNAGGLTAASPTLTEAWAYSNIGASGGGGSVSVLWDRYEELEPLVQVTNGGDGGTATMKISTTVSKALCDSMRDQREVALVANAPLGIGDFTVDAPGWGGTFKIRCVKGEVKWGQGSVLGLGVGDDIAVTITSKGSKKDQITFSGIPLLDPWLSVLPEGPIDLKSLRDDEGELKDEEYTIHFALNAAANRTDCAPPRTAVVKATTTDRGEAEITITEHDGCYLKWSQETLTGTGSLVVDLAQEGPGDEYVDTLSPGYSLPDWVRLVAPTEPALRMPRTNGSPTTTTFGFYVEARERSCVDQPKRTATFTVVTEFRGQATLTIEDPAIPKFTDCGFKFNPTQINSGGMTTAHIRLDALAEEGAVADVTVDTARLPSWMSVAPTTWTMAQGGSQEFLAMGSPPFDACRGTSAMTIPVFADAALPDGSSATATVNVKIAAKPPTKNCKPKDAGAWGDPHMWSFDGTHWEGQFVGEYIYSQTTPGAAVEQRLVVRTSPTRESAPPSSSPTSVRAIAFDVDGHRLELYATETAPELLIDGVLTTMVVHEVRTVGDHMSVVRTGNTTYRVDGDGLGFSIRQYSAIFDIEVTATTATSVIGLLGSPDDDASNDFTTPTGTVYPPSEIVQWYDYAASFQAFVGSWRITDPAQSPFSRPDPVIFAAPNPGYDPAVMVEFGPQVDAIFAEAALVCATPAHISDGERYKIALELSIGTPVEQLKRYTCRYSVGGVAEAQGSPVSGLQVTVDGQGILPCVATTATDGSYRCLAMPDFAEAAANPPAPPTAADPFQLSVVAKWPTRPDIVATGTASFLEFSPANGSPANATVHLDVDPNSLPWLDVSGAVVFDGVPQTGPMSVVVHMFRDNGSLYDSDSYTVTRGANGGWSLHVALPPFITRADARATLFTPFVEYVEGSVADVQLGSNPLVLDATLTLKRLHVTGTLTDGTNPLGPQSVSVFARAANGAQTVLTQTVTPAADGTYTLDAVLPLSTVSAYTSASIGLRGERFLSEEIPVAAGTTNLSWNVVYRPALVDLTGSVTGTLGQTVRVDVRFYRGTTLLGSSRNPVTLDAQGRYTTSVVGYTTADRVLAVLDLASGSDTYTEEFTGIVQGPNALTWDLVATPVVLNVSGRMIDESTGLALPAPVSVTTQLQNAANQFLPTKGTSVTPASDGTYTMTVIADHTVVKATLTAYAGADLFTKTVTGLVPGSNSAVFDVGLRAPSVGVSGQLTTGTPAVGRTGNYRAVLTGYDASGSIVTTRTAFVGVAADGSYSFGPYQLPSSVVSVTFVIEIGGGNNFWQGDWVRFGQTPVGPGTNQLTLSNFYDPPTLHLSGAALVDGVTLPRIDLEVRAIAPDASIIGTTYTHATVTAGRYDTTLVLPLGTDDVAFVLRSPNNYQLALSGYEADFGPTEDRTVTFDFDESPVRLQVSGTLELFGEVPVSVTLTAVGFGASGGQLVQVNAYPSLAPDGSYAVTLELPEATTKALVFASAYPPDFSRSYGFPGLWYEPLTQGTQPIVYSSALRGVRVAGSVLRDGSPLPALGWGLPVTIQWPGGQVGTNAGLDQDSGAMSLDASVPADVDQVQISLDWFPDVPPLIVDLTGGWNDAVWDVDLSGLRLVRIHGAMDRDDYGRFLNTRAVVTSLTIDPANSLAEEPWTTGTSTSLPMQDGGFDDDDYSLVVSVPADATHLRVGFSSYGDEQPSQVYDLAAMVDDGSGVLDLRHDSVTTAVSPVLRVDVRATTTFPCAARSLWIDATVWWFPEEPADTSNGDPSSWEGGEHLGTRTVVPELWNQSGSNLWDLPSASGWIYIDSRPWAGYPMGMFPSSWGNSQTLDGVWQYQAASVDLEASCQQQLLRVHGTYAGDEAQYANTRVVVRRYDMLPGNFIGTPPWRELSTTFSPILPIAGSPGQFETYVPLLQGTVFTVQVLADGAEDGPVSVFVRDALPDPNAPVVDVTVDPLVGRSIGIALTPFGDDAQMCSADSLWVDVTLWWFPSDPVDKSSGDPADWEGAVPLGTRTIVPDLTNGGEGVQFWSLPDGPGWVWIGVGEWSEYQGLFPTGFSTSANIPPEWNGASFTIGLGEAGFGCVGIG